MINKTNYDHYARKVLIVNGVERSATSRYRVYAAEQCLRKMGFEVDICTMDRLDSVSIEKVAVCLFVRTPLSERVGVFVERLKSAKVVVIADFDDLIFRPELLHLIDGVKYLPSAERKQFVDRSFHFQEMIRLADWVVATTLPLSVELSRFNKNVTLIRNYPLELTRSIAVDTRIASSAGDRFVIGYYSGTLSHQADFRQCAGALARLIWQHREVELRVVGKLNMSEFEDFEGLESRICQVPEMPYEEMLLDLAKCDVSIAPLELDNVFCQCKSELKYFDAALMCVPTIASPTKPFQMAIRHGVNGFLAGTMDEWSNCFAILLLDKTVAQSVGRKARRDVLSYFGQAAQLNDYRRLMDLAVFQGVSL